MCTKKHIIIITTVCFHLSIFFLVFSESTASVGSPEVSPKAEGDMVTSPECHDQHGDPFDSEKPRKVRPVSTTPDHTLAGGVQGSV